MSLVKTECTKCWLPPDTNSQFCRRCAGPSQKHDVQKIRFSHVRADCLNFREKISNPKYVGNSLPEECLYCVNYIFTGLSVSEVWKRATANFLFFIQSPENIEKTIKHWLRQNHELTLEVITYSLGFFHDDEYTAKKIITSLVAASGKKKWILQELVMRPQTLGFLLANPMILPGPFSETLWGYLESFEEWWGFWQEIRVAVKRKIKFRSLQIKEDLMIVTWHPDRFIDWCFDVEEREELGEDWPISPV